MSEDLEQSEEIEKLELACDELLADNSMLRDALSSIKELEQECDEALADNAMLREALTSIRNGKDNPCSIATKALRKES